jgi:tRNA-2-methylthio-N6-dimethylallyladenosine synthase
LGQLRNWRDKKVVITGCILKNDRKMFSQKNAFLWDNQEPEKLAEFLNIKEPAILANLLKTGRSTAPYVPIMLGCNNFCTYCAVPYTRGRETSRAFDAVVEDFKALVQKGVKEITLLGQNVNSYQFGFAKLLKTLNDLPGDFSFTSNHPKDMTDEVIEAIAALPKVIKRIHLPVQSGSDGILKAMNRPYTKKQYLDLVDRIKNRIPNIEITTDVIVGFPGETESDFQATVDLFKKVGYSIAYVNKYSPRAGTVAFKLGDPIPWSEKQRRWSILNEIANKSIK